MGIVFFIVACILSCFVPIHGVSIPELTSYPQFCQLAADDDAVFATFKRNPIYNRILEHVSYDEGLKYLDFIREYYPDLIPLFDRFKENDSLGNPVTYVYDGIGAISPTTLRYIKVAGDLKKEFGDALSTMRIVEIGGGYGGQCKILKELCGFKSYTLIDLAPCNALSQKYLGLQGVSNVNYIASTALETVSEYDLVISNYAFSEIDKTEQLGYLQKVIDPTPRGYMTFNFIMEIFSLEALTMNDIITRLMATGRKGVVSAEDPSTSITNQLLVWKEKNDQFNSVLKNKRAILPARGMQRGKAISYSLSGGRFGDNIMAYLHAKWAARVYGIPLLYFPFPNGHLLKLETMDPTLGPLFSFRNQMRIERINQIEEAGLSTLITVPYFPECKFEYTLPHMKGTLYFPVNWEDPVFREEVTACLQPTNPVSTLDPPSGCITVAVHVRRGGAYETHEDVARGLPLKAPPDSYYIDQIKTVATLFKDQTLYIHIFTDDLNPAAIVDKYRNAIGNPNLVFGYGSNGRTFNNSTEEMLHDFYSMRKFDCLIRCMSNFSLVASLLGDYTLMITPTSCHLENDKTVVDQLEIRFRS